MNVPWRIRLLYDCGCPLLLAGDAIPRERQAYADVGPDWLMAPTRWPGLRHLADLAYRIFARNRLRWAGRASACEAGRCQIAATRAPASNALARQRLGSSR